MGELGKLLEIGVGGICFQVNYNSKIALIINLLRTDVTSCIHMHAKIFGLPTFKGLNMLMNKQKFLMQRNIESVQNF